MKSGVLNHAEPTELENQRIAEVKALSYVERLERLMAILEISQMTKNAGKHLAVNNERTNTKSLEMLTRQ